MAETKRHLTEEEIHKVYEILGIANEEQRQEILKRISFSPEVSKGPIYVRGDSVTSPYPDRNA